MFTIEQTYDLRATTSLNVAMRKTVRRWYSYLRGVVWMLLAVSVATLAVSFAIGTLDVRDDWVFLLSIVVITAFLLFDDRLNGWISLRRMFPGSAHSVAVFADERYVVSTIPLRQSTAMRTLLRSASAGTITSFFSARGTA